MNRFDLEVIQTLLQQSVNESMQLQTGSLQTGSLLLVEPEQVDRMEVPMWCHKCKCVGPSPEELTI